MPTADPPPCTVTAASRFFCMYWSASFSANGWKAVEPASVTEFVRFPHPPRIAKNTIAIVTVFDIEFAFNVILRAWIPETGGITDRVYISYKMDDFQLE